MAATRRRVVARTSLSPVLWQLVFNLDDPVVSGRERPPGNRRHDRPQPARRGHRSTRGRFPRLRAASRILFSGQGNEPKVGVDLQAAVARLAGTRGTASAAMGSSTSPRSGARSQPSRAGGRPARRLRRVGPASGASPGRRAAAGGQRPPAHAPQGGPGARRVQIALVPYVLSPWPWAAAPLYGAMLPEAPPGAAVAPTSNSTSTSTASTSTSTTSTSTTSTTTTTLPAGEAPVNPPPPTETAGELRASIAAEAQEGPVPGFSDGVVDALLARASATLDPGTEAGLYTQIDHDLWVDLPTLPLFQQPVTLVLDSALVNVSESLTWAGPLGRRRLVGLLETRRRMNSQARRGTTLSARQGGRLHGHDGAR